MKLPHRAAIGVARVAALDPRRVGGHALDLGFDAGFVFAHGNGVVVTLAHLGAVQAGQFAGLCQQSLGFGQHGFARAFEIAF